MTDRCPACRWDALLEIVADANAEVIACGHVPPLYKSGVIYKPEPADKEVFMAIPAVIAHRGADCFPMGTTLLGEHMRVVNVEDVEVGQKIWGLDAFVEVEAKAFKGELEVDAVRLNNGSTVCLTPDHHVYVLMCSKGHDTKKYGCSCLPSERVTERVRVSDLEPYMVLPQPSRLPFGRESHDPDRAYVEGLFISDGWATDPYRFQISGQDGSRKEAQKREVEAICARLGLNTYWNRKYIAVNDREWTIRMQEMGARARFKHALSLDLDESSAASLLRGIMADANVLNSSGAGRTFTTTSRDLAIQIRILHRMFARSTSYAFIENHGGLGMHPIYRIGIRDPRKAEKLLRVKSIMRRVARVPCWDIQTSDNRVYLPEHDVTVSQCEDLSAWRVAELRAIGERAEFVLTKFDVRGRPSYHVRVMRQSGQIEDPSLVLGMGNKNFKAPKRVEVTGASSTLPFGAACRGARCGG